MRTALLRAVLPAILLVGCANAGPFPARFSIHNASGVAVHLFRVDANGEQIVTMLADGDTFGINFGGAACSPEREVYVARVVESGDEVGRWGPACVGQAWAVTPEMLPSK